MYDIQAENITVKMTVVPAGRAAGFTKLITSDAPGYIYFSCLRVVQDNNAVRDLSDEAPMHSEEDYQYVCVHVLLSLRHQISSLDSTTSYVCDMRGADISVWPSGSATYELEYFTCRSGCGHCTNSWTCDQCHEHLYSMWIIGCLDGEHFLIVLFVLIAVSCYAGCCWSIGDYMVCALNVLYELRKRRKHQN